MAQYSFKYYHGQSMLKAHDEAGSDDHFFKTVIPAWEKKTGFKYVPGTVTCAITEYRKVPEPATSSQARAEYLVHAKKMADPRKPFAY